MLAPDLENLNAHSFVSEELRSALMDKYKHRIHRELEEKAKEVGGHGGMDFIMDYRLVFYWFGRNWAAARYGCLRLGRVVLAGRG